MDIAQYISDLLNEHNEVSLPGIGTFFKGNISAYFNESEGLFYPPSHTIDFKQEEGSSAILINHIISRKHISESSAIYFIERFSENIKNSLEKNSNADLPPIGSLIKSSGGYVLESSSKISGSNYFGLAPLKEREVLETTESVVPAPVDEDINETLIEESASGSKKIWVTLAIVLFLASIIALAYFYYPQYFKNFNFSTTPKPNSKDIIPVVKPDETDSLSFADSIVNQLDKHGMHGSVEQARDTATISSEATSPDSLKTEPLLETVYEIIIGSFALKKEAETSVKNLRSNGIDAKVVIDTRKPRFKVSVGTFTSKSAANKENKRIQQNFKDAWILEIINKENQ